MPKNSMVHWNGNQLCAIDVETTGLDPFVHEIVQICILPLDSNVVPRKDVIPFYIEIRPEFPERRDPEAMTVTKLDMNKIMERGHDREKAKDLLVEWSNKLGLPLTRGGNYKCKIMPLWHNGKFDYCFILGWLGVELYGELFHGLDRDTMHTTLYQNDKAAAHAEDVPFKKNKLSWVANALDIEDDPTHDALQDCLATAAVYRKLINQGLGLSVD